MKFDKHFFTDDFMKTNTKFQSIDEFFKAGNFVVETQQDFKDIDVKDLDKFTVNATQFKNWSHMLTVAMLSY